MKTLIINGSPKKNGDTGVLVEELAKHLNGEVKIISCFNEISPCDDCRYCWTNSGCKINDEMQDIYPFLEECDNIVLASPIWFSSLSGPALNLASRIQTLFAAKYFRHELKEARKNGVLILTGAENGTQVTAEKIALTIMKHLYVCRPCVATIFSLDTNNVPAEKDELALRSCRETALLLNRLCV